MRVCNTLLDRRLHSFSFSSALRADMQLKSQTRGIFSTAQLSTFGGILFGLFDPESIIEAHILYLWARITTLMELGLRVLCKRYVRATSSV